MCLVVNIFSSMLVFLPFVCVSGVSRILGLLTLGTIHLVSGVVNGVSAYGCMELRSIILQNSFLAIDMTVILDKYMREEDFRHNWDNLQRQYFCCGTFNFNIGYTDWKNYYNNNSVPDSCCHIESPECGGKFILLSS